jgi:disulfide bond formation protein DsbB
MHTDPYFPDLEKALNEQRAFWKFLGVMMIVVFVLYFVGAIVIAATAGFAAMKASGKM